MNGAFAVYGTIMVGIPAPAIVGRSLRVGSGVPVESEVTNELEEPPEVLEPVLSAEDEESVVDASVDVAVDLLESDVDSAVDFAVVDVASSVWSPRVGRSFWAYARGAPARASSASSCVFFVKRTIFAVSTAEFGRRMVTARLMRCYEALEVCAVASR